MDKIGQNKEDKIVVKEFITFGSKIASLFECEEMCWSKTDLAEVLRVDSFALCRGAWNKWELPGETCLIRESQISLLESPPGALTPCNFFDSSASSKCASSYRISKFLKHEF